MKAGDIWAGHEYAWKENKPKGVETPMGATKVRVIRVTRKKAHFGSERLSAFVDVELLQDVSWVKKAGDIIEVRARDIVDHWEDYSIREEEILSERRNKERKEQEQKAKLEAEKQSIQEAFLERGLAVTTNFHGTVIIEKEVAMIWLGLKKEQTELEKIMENL